MERYVLVSFPEIQDFMEHPRWSECVFCQEIQGHPCPDSTYAVPEDLYCEVIWSSDKIPNIIGKIPAKLKDAAKTDNMFKAN